MSSPARTDVVRHTDGREQCLHVWEAAGDPRAIVVLVHGYAEHAARYDHVARRLAGAGIAVWSTDLRGHGRSSGERASVSAIAELVADARFALDRARAAYPGVRVFLVGHSMGGLVATRFFLEAQREIAGLVLSGAAISDPTGVEAVLEVDPLPPIVLSSDLLSRDPAVVAAYDADPLVYRGPFRRETLAALAHGAREVRARAHEIVGPLLVLHGADDAIVPAVASEELFAAVGSADKELTAYPGLRHEILNEPEGGEIVDRIAAWIAARA
ncbi:MAG TPA: alpha/beta hydrolase [Candidatus Binatia bacterium]|nr:alpha/beta hydrolase [Candidatus Binatia bacterium]